MNENDYPQPQPTPQEPEPQSPPPEAPLLQTQPLPPQPFAINNAVQPPVKKKRTGLIVGIVGGVVGLLLLAAVLLYFLWWQSPDKVVARAIVNYVQQGRGEIGGTVTVESPELSLAMEIDSRIDGVKEAYELKVSVQQPESPLETIDLSLDLVYPDDGAFYARVTDLDKIVDSIVDLSMEQVRANSDESAQIPSDQEALIRAQVEQMFNPIVEKINNQWVRFSIEESSEQTAEATCLVDAVQKLNTDKDTQKEISRIYSENSFLIVSEEVGKRDGSTGYKIDLKDEQASQRFNSFKEALIESDYGKEILACDAFELEDFDFTEEGTDTKDETLVLWVNKSSNTLTGVDLSFGVDQDEQDMKFEAKLDLTSSGEAGAIEAPQDARDFEELMQEVMSAMFGGGVSSQDQIQPIAPTSPLSV